MATLEDIFSLLQKQNERLDAIEEKVNSSTSSEPVPVDSYGFPILPRPATPPKLRPYVAPEPLRPLVQMERGAAPKQ